MRLFAVVFVLKLESKLPHWGCNHRTEYFLRIGNEIVVVVIVMSTREWESVFGVVNTERVVESIPSPCDNPKSIVIAPLAFRRFFCL